MVRELSGDTLSLFDAIRHAYKGDQPSEVSQRSASLRSRLDQTVEGVTAVVDQQFEVGKQIIGAGLVPIIEPEVDINSARKAEAEALLKTALMENLDKLGEGQLVMLKLTLPEVDNFYDSCIQHPNVLKVVALSGGYSREEANQRLASQNGMVASFSRALSEGLSAQQSDEEFNSTLDASIESIFQASNT